MKDFDDFMKRFCALGADAVRRYIAGSDLELQFMPEYFIQSLIFRSLCEERAVTLETPCWQLLDWIGNHNIRITTDDAERGWKLDMVIYDGGGKAPKDQSIWALVEMKKGYIDADINLGKRTDRQKLLRIREWFGDDRPHLICCGAISDMNIRDYHIRMAAERGDLWFEAPVNTLPPSHGPHSFCARVILN